MSSEMISQASVRKSRTHVVSHLRRRCGDEARLVCQEAVSLQALGSRGLLNEEYRFYKGRLDRFAA
jgi:hypothetical protein